MAKSNRQKVRYVKKGRIADPPQTDIISELPLHIRETIVGFLPIEDAVRTSILARRWRYCWTMIPNLIFGHDFVDRILSKLNQYDDPVLKALKLVGVINKVLLLHNGPILRFCFSSCEQDCDSQIFHDYIDQWIPLLSSKGTKQLVLEDKESGVTAHHLSSLDLTYLKLTYNWFPFTPRFRVFPYLTNLELIHVEILDLAKSGQRIFDCPVLEKLTLIVCSGILPTNFCAPKLKSLLQLSNEITSEYSLAGLKNLTEFSFGLLEKSQTQTITSNVDKLLGCVPKIEKIYIAMESMVYLAAGRYPKTLSKPLSCLKTLNIDDIYFNILSEVFCLICLIRSAPNLCKLNILAVKYVEGDLEKYQIEDSEDWTMDHLEIVTFGNFRGLRAELGLVKFLLARSPLLKNMLIHFHYDLEKDAALTMLKEILQYPAASSGVEVKRMQRSFDMDEFFDYHYYFC